MSERMTLSRARCAAAAGAGAAVSVGLVAGTAVGIVSGVPEGLAAGGVVSLTWLSATVAAVRIKVTDPGR